jgi:hypothetical protein
MPAIDFILEQRNTHFEVDENSEDWKIYGYAKCSSRYYEEFSLYKNGRVFDGFGSIAYITVRLREPRSVEPLISVEKPYDYEDKHRDHVSVDTIYENESALVFSVSISLPKDAWYRLFDSDLKKEEVAIVVGCKDSLKQAFSHGSDPDGSDIQWKIDESSTIRPDQVSLRFTSLSVHEEVCSEEKPLTDSPLEAVDPSEKLLHAIEENGRQILEFRKTVVISSWAIAIIIVVISIM